MLDQGGAVGTGDWGGSRPFRAEREELLGRLHADLKPSARVSYRADPFGLEDCEHWRADGDDDEDVEVIPTAPDLPELARVPPCELDYDEVRLWSSQT